MLAISIMFRVTLQDFVVSPQVFDKFKRLENVPTFIAFCRRRV